MGILRRLPEFALVMCPFSPFFPDRMGRIVNARDCQNRGRWTAACLCWLTWLGLGATPGWAEPPCGAGPEAGPQALSLDGAVAWGLRNNPDLAALRQQHGIAAAGVVIARTYPFNPTYQGKIWPDSGPAHAGSGLTGPPPPRASAARARVRASPANNSRAPSGRLNCSSAASLVFAKRAGHRRFAASIAQFSDLSR